MPACSIALGGNLGDVLESMERALQELSHIDGVRVSQISPVYETTPVGCQQSFPFLNAAAQLECEIDSHELLRHLQCIENLLGRRRTMRWDARPIDLDILLYGEEVINSADLSIPHPHLWYRRFVLDPLVDIAAQASHPLWGITIAQLRRRLLQRPLSVALTSIDREREDALADRLHAQFPAIKILGALERWEDAGLVLDFGVSTSTNTYGRSDRPRNEIRLAELPGSLEEAAVSVLTAALSDSAVHNRPLRRIP